MKKILIIISVLFLLAAAALAYFIATFDADRYRSLIETKASQLTGFPVHLGGVSLAWKNGLALEVRDVAVRVRAEDQTPAPVSIRSAYVALEVMPLLRGTVQMGSIIVEEPEVRLTRSPDGRLHGVAELGQAKSSQKTQPSAGAESTLALLIQNLNIRGGKFIFQDQSGGRVRDYTIDKIDLHLRDVSLLNAFPVELKAAVLSDQQNMIISGKVHARLTKQEVELKDFILTTDLETLDTERLFKAFPELRDRGMPTIEGHLEAHLADMTLRERLEPLFSAQINLNQGRVVTPETGAIENIALSSEVATKGLHVKSLSADWGGGHLVSSGKIDWRKAPFLNGLFQVDLSNVDLSRAVPAPENSREPGIKGIMAASLQGTFAGADALAITQALVGDGNVVIRKGVITNLNILKEVLDKLSIIPGVSQKIQSRLSETYLERLNERDTRLEDVELPVRMRDGFVFLDPIVIKSDTFQISGRAQAAFVGPLNGRLLAAIDSEFSAALMRSVNELQYIADQSGQIAIPITLRGTLEKPEVIPEVQQLASRLAVAKTQDLLSGLLTKKKPETEGGAVETTNPGAEATPSLVQASQSSQPVQPTDPFAALLGQVLQAATQKKSE